MPNQKEIAKKCGVSVAAVSAAFRRPEHLSKETREKILSAARDLGYLAARFEIKNIGLLFNNFRNHFLGEYFNEILFGIFSRLSEQGLRAQIFEKVPEKYQEICEISGFLVIGNDAAALVPELQKHGLPLVLVECTKGRTRGQHNIYFDNLSGVEQLTEYVLTCNHRKIALLNGETDPNDIFWQKFQKGIRSAFQKNRVSQKGVKIYPANYAAPQSVEIAVNRILSARPLPSCIMCSNDSFAYRAGLVLEKNKIHVPKDISITGFDGIGVPPHLKSPLPTLTTVFADRVALGRRAVDYLLEVIARPQKAPPEIRLETSLRVGDTVKRI